jgi:dihydroorotate dehydrogenase
MHTITGLAYQNLIKPVLFRIPADHVHDFFLKTGRIMGSSAPARSVIRTLWAYENSLLSQYLCGITFANPIGLAAGFDYNADVARLLPSMGFGFNTVGTLTYEAYEGNHPPMLGRLPKSQSLLINKGFKNKGIAIVLSHLDSHTRQAPLGISIGATNKSYPTFEAMIENLVTGFQTANTFADFDYFELNISCPNLLNLRDLPDQVSSPTGLTCVLERLQSLKLRRPVFIKMPSERSFKETDALCQVAASYAFVKGLIFSNLVKDRSNPAFDREEIKKAGKGNFSGRPTQARSDELICFAHHQYGDRFVIIGVGGVFTAEDAYRKIRLGASLVQMITGMIFMGPQQIGVINEGLVALLRRDGFSSISEAVGSQSVMI